ncbi:MAG: hypothetical protein M1819_004849 [Sarea resinae]|nr:MAG: hypothetical protein M1819_004849 [Sarea resinae]
MDTEDGQDFIKNLAYFVRTHEKALANALQLRNKAPKNGQCSSTSSKDGPTAISPTAASPYASSQHQTSTSSALAAALSFPGLSFSHNIKPAKLSLTPHHLFYLLSRFEELGIIVGPMNVRLENIHTDVSPANYVSFLSQSQRSKGRNSDRDSIHSISSVRSVMSGMSSLWSSFNLGSSNSAAKTEKAKAAIEADLKYLYSAFTKIPCLRLSPDRKARLIAGYEEFPFDSAVPLIAFKNISALEITDVDFRQFFGWDRLAEQLRSLSVKRGGVEDPADLLINVVLDDIDKRRRRSSKVHVSPVIAWATPSPTRQPTQMSRSISVPGTPQSGDRNSQATTPTAIPMIRAGSEGSRIGSRTRPRSASPSRPGSSRQGSSHGKTKDSANRSKRSGSASSASSSRSSKPHRSGSGSNLKAMTSLPASKWRFLKHLSLADNSLTYMTASSLSPLSDTLHSLDLSSNLFTEIPDSLAILVYLRALNLSHCMIGSLHSLSRNPIPAIAALNLRANRLNSIAGIERLPSLERLDIRDNKLTDPTELARLTSVPEMREIWVAGNPFTKTHKNYRVTIFNIFRRSPGYTEDVIIDAYGPTYSERRQLVDRVAEPENVPVVRPPPQDQDTSPQIDASKPEIKSSIAEAPVKQSKKERPVAKTTKSDITGGSTRRRKGPKRRIVNLAQNDSALDPPGESEAVIKDGSVRTSDASNISPVTPRPSQQRNPTSPSPLPQHLEEDDQIGLGITKYASPADLGAKTSTPVRSIAPKETPDWNLSGEIYKQKIEALRTEVGSGWLSVLSEESWDSPPPNARPTNYANRDFSPASVVRPSPTTAHSAGSQPIVSGSRTLG